MNVLYTGARSGIASKVISKLIQKDYTIYVTVKTEVQLQRVKEKYKDIPNVQCFKLDIASSFDRKKIAELPIDVLVCNAAIGYGGSISEIAMDKVRENFEVNLFSNFELVQTILKQMIKRGQGRIVIMASLAGIVPIPFLGSYCATKASIIKFAECLKLELKMIQPNIEVCLIEPGLYHTGFNQVMFENKYKDMKNGYFKEELKLISKRETLLFRLLEKKSLDSIVTKIVHAIESSNPKFLYRAPFFQVVGSKIIQTLS